MRFTLLTLGALLAGCQATGEGQRATRDPGGALQKPSKDVPFRLLSLEATRFERPVRIGPGKRAITYGEALVIRLSVAERDYDGVPPDVEPFLYVGARELRTHRIDRPKGGERGSRRLVLTFHVPEWQSLEDGAPMVLTAHHGRPIREPRRYEGAIPFRVAQIVDRR